MKFNWTHEVLHGQQLWWLFMSGADVMLLIKDDGSEYVAYFAGRKFFLDDMNLLQAQAFCEAQWELMK